MKILSTWLDLSKDIRPNDIDSEDLLLGLRAKTEQKIGLIQSKISELEALCQSEFKYRYKKPETESENVIKAVEIALAKERREFIEFLRFL